MEVGLSPALTTEGPIEQDARKLASPGRFARLIIASEPVGQSIGARLDAAAQRLEDHGDDQRGYDGVERGIVPKMDCTNRGSVSVMANTAASTAESPCEKYSTPSST